MATSRSTTPNPNPELTPREDPPMEEGGDQDPRDLVDEEEERAMEGLRTYQTYLRRQGLSVGGLGLRLAESPLRREQGRTEGTRDVTSRVEARSTTTGGGPRRSHNAGVKELSHVAIRKLGGREGYDDWVFMMKKLLGRHGLWEVVSGEWPKPSREEDEEAWVDWMARSDSAIIIIASNAEASEMVYIRTHEEAPDVWNELKKVYSRDQSGTIISLRLKLSTMKQDGGESLDAYAKRLKDLFLKLRGV
jgi:hypothetical protein